MDPVKWLEEKAPGFGDLNPKERDAIMHFALLWSFFEARVLNTHACASAIVRMSKRWEDGERLNAASFGDCLKYFQNRYFQNDAFTAHFAGLCFRRDDKQQLVECVLRGKNKNIGDTVAALLIIVYRLRNNLFHGTKWADQLRGQLDNFTNANALLMLTLDLHMLMESNSWI